MSFRSNSQKHNHSISKYNNHLFLFARQMRNRDRYIFVFSSIRYDTKYSMVIIRYTIIKIYQLVLHVFHFWILSFYDWIFFINKQGSISFPDSPVGLEETGSVYQIMSLYKYYDLNIYIVEHKRKRYCWEWIGCCTRMVLLHFYQIDGCWMIILQNFCF